METVTNLKGVILDVVSRSVYSGSVILSKGRVADIVRDPKQESEEKLLASKGPFIMAGLVDAHIHIDDSLLPPSEFARVAVTHGTVATVSDPHEIGNVLGIEGIQYMIANGKTSPLKFHFQAPACVPSTNFETAGAKITAKEVAELVASPDIYGLGEVMDFPGVIQRNPDMMAKLEATRKSGKAIDGHAPLVSGANLISYMAPGISTDHECSKLEEAREKIKAGMKVIIREGSAARNLSTLMPLVDEFPDMVMFCVDDILPNDLKNDGEIDYIIRTCLKQGCKLFNVLRASTVISVNHYKLNVGLLRKGDPGDVIVINNIKDFKVLKTYIDGKLVFDESKKEGILQYNKPSVINNFCAEPITANDIVVKAADPKKALRVIEALDKDLNTNSLIVEPTLNAKQEAISDPTKDLLKIVVLNRYVPKAKPSVGFVRGFGLKTGALAYSIAHDSHNIVCVGVEDEYIVKAINLIIGTKGGKAAACKEKAVVFPLPIAGLMSDQPADIVIAKSEELDNIAKALGTKMGSPYATMCFMALPVIPVLKITDMGLFDVLAFHEVPLFCDSPSSMK